MLSFILAASLVTATAAPSPTPRGISLGGATLGETASQLIADRGEPMAVFQSGATGAWFYFSPGGASLEVIGIGRGYVTGVAISGKKTAPPALPEDETLDGVQLDGPYSDVPPDAKDGVLTKDGVTYSFRPSKDTKRVQSMAIRLSDDALAKLPALTVMPLLHDGSSITDAVVIRAPSSDLADVFEGGYMAGHDFCNPDRWKKIGSSVTQANGKTYTLLNAGCMKSDKTKTIYFDVTSVPGVH